MHAEKHGQQNRHLIHLNTHDCRKKSLYKRIPSIKKQNKN